MRVAWLSPLPPEGSGIADYSTELLPWLAREVEVEAFTARPQAAAAHLPAALPVHAYADLPRQAGRFDAVVHHLGNSAPYHEEIWKLVPRVPGVVVLHEFVLHHLVRELTLVRGAPEAFVEEMRYACGESGRRAARSFLDDGMPLDPFTYPLFERAVDASRAVVVHNRHARQRVLASRPLARVEVVPMAFGADPGAATDAARREARRRLGLPEEATIFASFGWVTPVKRVEVTLRAFAEVRRRVPAARLLLVGQVSPYFDLAAVLAEGLGEGVTVVGRTGLDEFHRFMQAADVAINLRHPSAGETSATLIRLLGVGLPVVVSDHGSFAEVPDGCCAKVAIDWAEEELLLATLRRLAEDPALRRAMGAAARRWALSHHDPRSVARAWRTALAATASAPVPGIPAPPLAPWPATDLATDLVARAGAALADLGIGEGDDEATAAVAEALVALDLDAGWRA